MSPTSPHPLPSIEQCKRTVIGSGPETAYSYPPMYVTGKLEPKKIGVKRRDLDIKSKDFGVKSRDFGI